MFCVTHNIFIYIYVYRWALGAILGNKSFSDFDRTNVNIYVLDTEVNINHPEFNYLTTKVNLGGQMVGGDHGTHVTGTIMGETIGVLRDPNIELYTWGACGTWFCALDDILNGLITFINHLNNTNGTKRGVINMSLGGYCGLSCDTYDSYFGNFKSIGGIVVVAAGNSDDDACYYGPAYATDAITVGSYTSNYTRSYFSNYGDCIDSWGPGSNIYSSFYNGYGYFDGTSMASPAVAGLVGAILLTDEQDITFEEIKSLLQCSNDNCTYVTNITDAKSTNEWTFSYDCDIIETLFVTLNPTMRTAIPSSAPTLPTQIPTTGTPTIPTILPTLQPTVSPSIPTIAPTERFLFCGETINGSIISNGEDRYKFMFGYLYSVEFSSCGSTFDTVVTVYNEFGHQIIACDWCGICALQATISYQPIINTLYYFGISGYFASSFGDYTVKVTCNNITLQPTLEPSIATTEPTTVAPTMSTSQPTQTPTRVTSQPTIFSIENIATIYCGNTVTGSIKSYETNYYKIVNVSLDVTSIEFNSCGSLYDTWIQIYNYNLTLIYEWYICIYIYVSVYRYYIV